MKLWRDINGIYQIYPRSFLDTNADGVGDLPGIMEKLGYLKDTLGIDAIWLSPIYRSPMADFGYDIADYCDIDPTFGTLEDFKVLLGAAHAKDMKVMMDLVPNHTSDQHEWFKESRSSRDNPKRDWYVWLDGKPDGSLPNNWLSQSGGPAWTFDETTGQYYLHSFMAEQPDLNWENPDVREAVKNAMRFWFDMGVDGFRVDAVWGLSKDLDFADDPRNWSFEGEPTEHGYYIHRSCKQGPYFQDRLKQIADVAAEYDDRLVVLEFYPDDKLGDPLEQYRMVYSLYPGVCSSFFFEGLRLPWSAAEFGHVYHQFFTSLGPEALPTSSIGNHDQPRVASRLSHEQARLMAMMQLTVPGLPFIYYGDEIGMEDVELRPDQMRDPFITEQGTLGGRDPERTPMQWDASEYAGFSQVEPWLPVSPNHALVNVAEQQKDEDSMLALHRRLLAFRSENKTIRTGRFETIDVTNGYVFAYKRFDEDGRYYVLLNFDNYDQRVWLPEQGQVIYSTHVGDDVRIDEDGALTLFGYQGVVIKA